MMATRQMVSDVLGLPVTSSPLMACGAMGASLQAAVTFFHQNGENLSYAEITNYTITPKKQNRCEPDADRHAFYRELLGRQETLKEILSG